MGFIQEQNIFLNQIGQTQNDIFEFLAKKTVDLTIADNQKEVLEKLIERENEGTTGMMDGFAIPHAKDSAIHHPAAIILKLKEKVVWQSLDGQPIQFIIALFVPDTQADDAHLKLLSTVARLLMRDDIRASLKEASSADEIAKLLNNQTDEVA